jgi:hypothetical protein
MEKQITVEEVLQMSINDLRSISVPIDLIQSIGMPVSRVIHNLGLCLAAFSKPEKPAEQQTDEPEIEIGPLEKVEVLPDEQT